MSERVTDRDTCIIRPREDSRRLASLEGRALLTDRHVLGSSRRASAQRTAILPSQRFRESRMDSSPCLLAHYHDLVPIKKLRCRY